MKAVCQFCDRSYEIPDPIRAVWVAEDACIGCGGLLPIAAATIESDLRKMHRLIDAVKWVMTARMYGVLVVRHRRRLARKARLIRENRCKR